MARKKAASPRPGTFGAQVDASRVVCVLGDDEGAKHYFLRKLSERSDRGLARVQGAADAAVLSARGRSGLWLVAGAGAVPLSDIVDLAREAGSLLVLEAEDVPAGSELEAVVGIVGEARVRRFKRPPPWDEAKVALEGVRSIAQDLGVGLGPGAGEVLAEGSADLGYLAREVEKLWWLAQARACAVVTADMARSCAGGALGPDVDKVAATLGDGATQALAASLAQVRAAQKQDPTPRVVAMLDRVAGQWLQAALLSDPDPERAATVLKVHPYQYRLKISGPARRWGVEGCLRLMGVLASADLAVRRGAAHPWAVLSSGLFSACLNLGRGRA